MDRGVWLMLKNVPDLAFPLETRGAVYLLVELACVSSRVPLDDILMEALEWGLDTGVVIDGALTASEAQRAHFWRVREEQPEGQRLEGPQLKHDISVPPGKIARFLETAEQRCLALLPGVRINPFGHLADGNIHYNLSPPEGTDNFGGKDEQLAQALAGLATHLGGSFAAEHGLGRAKVALADRFRSPVERQLMRRLKEAFDPASMINPGSSWRRRRERRTFQTTAFLDFPPDAGGALIGRGWRSRRRPLGSDKGRLDRAQRRTAPRRKLDRPWRDESFGVPGESYLAVLDALHDAPGNHYVLCRNEGGASFMASAYGKLTGSPGICLVTRGPGAANASIGVHTAMQDSSPMVLFVGQVGTDMRGREAFQEVDYRECSAAWRNGRSRSTRLCACLKSWREPGRPRLAAGRGRWSSRCPRTC